MMKKITCISIFPFLLLFPVLLPGQSEKYQEIADGWCKNGILTENLCPSKCVSPTDLLATLMTAIAKKSEDEYFYSYGYFTPEALAEARNKLSAPDTLNTYADDYTPHPDSILEKKTACRAMVSELRNRSLIDGRQAKALYDSIRNNRLLHPWFVAAAVLSDVVAQEMKDGQLAATIRDSLCWVMHWTPDPKLTFPAIAEKMPDVIKISPSAQVLQPEDAAKLIEKTLKQANPAFKGKITWRYSDKGFTTRCRIPVNRNVIVYDIPLAGDQKAAVEFEAEMRDGKPMIPSNNLLESENFANIFVQMEQETASDKTAILMINQNWITNKARLQLGIAGNIPSDIGPTYLLKMNEIQYQRIKKMKLKVAENASLSYPDFIFHRDSVSLSLSDKIRFWQKMEACGLMSRYPEAVQEYLWANLSIYPMSDSLEMLRQCFFVDYIDPFSRLGNAFKMFVNPVKSVPELNFLYELSEREMKMEDFKDFKYVDEGKGPTNTFQYTYKGNQESVLLGQPMQPADMAILASIATTWKKYNPEGKAFYFIPGTKGYILFLTKEEAEKFSGVMNLLIKPI